MEREMQPLLIVNGTLVTAEKSFKASLAIANGRITATGDLNPASFPGSRVIDASGKFVMPGGIDPHVHLSLPTPAGKSCDDFRSGSLAALAGGTTNIMDFVTPARGQSLHDALVLRRREAAESVAGYGLHMGISEWNHGIAAEILPLMENEGIRSFKAYLAYNETIGIDYKDLTELMHIVGQAGGLVMVHCEDGRMISRLQREFLEAGKTRPFYHALSRPPEAEANAIDEVIARSAKARCPVYIVHVSTGRGAGLIASAKKDGLKVYGETCPHYLLLDDAVYDPGLDDREVLPYVLSPPLRSREDREALWERLSDGTFDVVATDHCPFNIAGQKDRGLTDFTKIPNGAGSLGHRLSLLYTYGVLTQKISFPRFVSLVSTRPAEIFGMGHCKGKLQPGYDADLLICDPDYQEQIMADRPDARCDCDIYEGFRIRGKAEVILSGYYPGKGSDRD